MDLCDSFPWQATIYSMHQSQLVQQPQTIRQLKNFSSIRGPAFVPIFIRIINNSNRNKITSSRNSNNRRLKRKTKWSKPQQKHTKRMIQLVISAQMIWTKPHNKTKNNQKQQLKQHNQSNNKAIQRPIPIGTLHIYSSTIITFILFLNENCFAAFQRPQQSIQATLPSKWIASVKVKIMQQTRNRVHAAVRQPRNHLA